MFELLRPVRLAVLQKSVSLGIGMGMGMGMKAHAGLLQRATLFCRRVEMVEPGCERVPGPGQDRAVRVVCIAVGCGVVV